MGAMILAEAAYSEGKYAQKIPVYGGQRQGGAVNVFLRLDTKPILRNCCIYEPDAVVILDSTITMDNSVKKGLKKGGIAILNDTRKPEKVEMGVELSKVAVVDANKIYTEIFGRRAIPITNTIMLGAISKATSWVKLESLLESIKNTFTGQLIESNIDACKRGYDNVNIWEA